MYGFQRCLGGGDDLFLVKLSSRGERLWGTYYGGEKDEAGADLAIRGTRIVLAGETRSATGIATGNAATGELQGAQDLFLVEFDHRGTSRHRAGYFGGEDHEHGASLDFRSDDELYLAGTTRSFSKIATEDAFDETLSGRGDLFVARLDLDADHVVETVLDTEQLASGCDPHDLGGDGSLALLFTIFPLRLRPRRP